MTKLSNPTLWVLGILLTLAVCSGTAIGAAELVVTVNSTGEGTFDAGFDDIAWTDRITSSRSEVSRYRLLDFGDHFTLEGDPYKSEVDSSVSGSGVYSDGVSPSCAWNYVADTGPEVDIPSAVGLMVRLPPGATNSTCSVWPGWTTLVLEDPECFGTFAMFGTGGRLEPRNAGIDDVVFDFVVPAARDNWIYTRSYATNVNSLEGQHYSFTCTVTVQLIASDTPEYEAIMVPQPPPSDPHYEQWLPMASTDESSPGNSLLIDVYLRSKGDTNSVPPRARFHFVLADVSREPGFCLNSPPLYKTGQAQDEAPFDLKICTNALLTSTDPNRQSAQTSDWVTEETVEIECYDYGAFGKLKIIAETEDGQTLIAHLPDQTDQQILMIPKDDNANKVADAWEIAENRFVGYNSLPETDCANEPAGQAGDGDGISLYERYRGFKTLKGWGRLKAKQKYVFVRDTDGLLLSTILNPRSAGRCFPDVTKCRVLFIGPDQWTGPGLEPFHRVVNFNTSGFAHATDQHAILLEVNDDAKPLTPALWRQYANFYNRDDPQNQVGKELGEMVLGQTYPCPNVSAEALDSPATVYGCIIFRGNFVNQAFDMVRYHTMDLAEFRPMVDQVAWWAMTAEEKNLLWTRLEETTRKYIEDNPKKYSEWLDRMVGMVTTHELCHGLGALDHEGRYDGDHDCVMRYFPTGIWREEDYPRTQEDRFELGLRLYWPTSLCRSGNGQPEGSCWKAVRVSDKR